MLGWLTVAASAVSSLIGGTAKVIGAKIEANRAMKIAELVAGYKIAVTEGKYDTLIALENIRRRDKWLTRISFAVLYAPFATGLLWPEATITYFTTVVATFPEWFVLLFVSINVAQWGLRRLTRI